VRTVKTLVRWVFIVGAILWFAAPTGSTSVGYTGIAKGISFDTFDAAIAKVGLVLAFGGLRTVWPLTFALSFDCT
jgi:hypothetical protein